jgi:anti-anti-sigma regulatory factor
VDVRPHELFVHIGRVGHAGLVKVAGDLVDCRAAALQTHLVDALGSVGPRLVLDLQAVRSCQAAAVATIESVATRAFRRGGWLRLIAVPAVVAAAYAELGHRLPAYATVHQALSDEF